METWIVLAIVALSAAHLLRGMLKGSADKGCAAGCGACPTKHCALRKPTADAPRKSPN